MTGRMLMLGAMLAAPVVAYGQVPAVVQLPTVSVFSVQTTVWAPDRGATLLGGSSTASDFRRTWNGFLPAARVVASNRAVGMASVQVTITDHAAMDRALLAKAAERRGEASAPDRSVVEQARWLTQHIGRADACSGPSSVAEALQEQARQQQARQLQAAQYLAAGQRALAAGNRGAARVYFEMAARGGREDVRALAHEQLAAIASGKPH